MAKSYEDIGKEAIEFITKGFPNSGTFKFAAETKTPNGVTVKATGTRSFDIKDKDNVVEKIAGELEPKFEWKEHDLELTGKLATQGEFEGGVTFNNLAINGAKLSFTGIQSDSDGGAVKSSINYKHSQVAVKAGVKYPFKTSTHINWNGELTVKAHEKIYAGASALYDQAVKGEGVGDHPSDRKLYNVKAGYIDTYQQAIVSFENQLAKDKKTIYELFNFFYSYTLSSAIKFAVGATVERKNLKGTELHVAGEYKVDKDTVVKGKVSVIQAAKPEDKEFRVAIATKQNVTERVNVTVGADINARALLGAPGKIQSSGKPHSFGFEVKFQ